MEEDLFEWGSAGGSEGEMDLSSSRSETTLDEMHF